MIPRLAILSLLTVLGMVAPGVAFAQQNDRHYSDDGPADDPSPRYAESDTPQKTVKTVQGIRFDSNYDNGSLVDVRERGPDRFRAEIYTETGELGRSRYWFRFRMSGVAGRSIHLEIDHRRNPRPVVRLGDEPWRRMTAAEAPDAHTIRLDVPRDCDRVEVAFFYPLGYEETLRAVAEAVRGCDDATTGIIGTSHQGRDLWMVTVTNPNVPEEKKRRVWLHARVHPGEAPAAWAMLGFLRLATEDTPLGHWLRYCCIFHVIPMVNPDGVALGHTRWDSRGIDLEREWNKPGRTPEVAALHALVRGYMNGPSPIRVALNLHATQGVFTDTFFFKHVRPSVTEQQERAQQRYIEAFRRATPLFENRSPQTTQLDREQFFESYLWTYYPGEVMAITYEGHFHRRISDREYITDDDYLEMGRGLAVALVDYFDLPPPPPGDPWGWVMF